ncbi:MAG TPA: non-heme iron oxygenase ferredoxin subunit [Terrimicrobiaceae bacterium]
MALHKIAKTEDLPPGSSRVVEVADKSLAVFNVEGTFYVIDNHCTHDGAPLAEGEVRDGCVICPWHAAEFDLVTGEALTPPAVEDVRSYKVLVSEGDICIDLDEQ